MTTVNSLSGGKTSSYLAANYPADLELFSLVCIDSHNAGRKIDKHLKQLVNDKLQKYCKNQPEFVATSEDPQIIRTMLDLEQFLGREIIWVRGIGWEKMMRMKQAVPNIDKRFCTTFLKIYPIFEFLFCNTSLPVEMRVGFRYDELERMDDFDNSFRFINRCDLVNSLDDLKNEILKNAARPRNGGGYYINRWEEIIWRIGSFPLIQDKINHYHVHDFWESKNIVFPKDSNCQNCFWKDPQQLRKNFDTNPDIMFWAMIQEDIMGYTFKEEYSFKQIINMGIQLDFNFGTGSGCKAGFCTN